MNAEIVTTGTEILLGEIVDTNAAWIAQQLREAGVNLYFKTTVGDNEARLRGVLQLGMSRSDVILVTGGLGPTADDITRQAIANAAADSDSAQLVLHEGALATLKERFARFGSTMTENNMQQATIPAGATLIENPVGTAPGFIVEAESENGTCAIIAMPGVPREMKRMMTDQVLPWLRQRSGNTGIIRRRVLRTVGIGESTIDHRISELMAGANPSIGLAAHTAQCDVRITASAASADEAERMIDEMEETIRSRVGNEFIYSTTAQEPIEAVVAALLRERDATIAILETNTQGTLATRLDKVAEGLIGNSITMSLEDETVAVADEFADARAGVKAQSFSEETAIQAAQAMHQWSGATYGVALLGTCGEDEGVYGSKSGETWFAFSSDDETFCKYLKFGGRDEYTVTRLANSALMILWRHLSEQNLAGQ